MEDPWSSTEVMWSGFSLEHKLSLVPAHYSTLNPTESMWAQFMARLSSPKDPHLLQLGKNLERYQLPPDKIFVVAMHGYRLYEYCVYLVDISGKSNGYKYPPPLLEPIVRFSSRSCDDVVSILGTTLYLFDGGNTPKDYGTKMYFYDMRTSLLSGRTIRISKEDSNVQVGPEMTKPKRKPISVVICPSKICVFSYGLYYKPVDRLGIDAPCLSPNFEVYDTRKRSWISLPEPEQYHKLDPEISVFVDSYCVHESSLIIQTSLGIHGINVDDENPKWVKLEQSGEIQNFPLEGGGAWTMVDKHLFNPFKVVHRGDLTSCAIELTDCIGRESLIEEREKSGVSCLGGGVNNNCFVVVRGGLPSTPRYWKFPKLLVDVVKYDAEHLKNLEAYSWTWLKIQSDKSFNFSLNYYTPSIDMTVLGCFPLKVSLEDSLYFSNSQIKRATDINSLKSRVLRGKKAVVKRQHKGHFLLRDLLLETMKNTAPESSQEGRIVNVSSDFAYRGGIHFDKINFQLAYNTIIPAYGNSKLPSILQADEPVRQLKVKGADGEDTTTANSLHPGGIASNLGRHRSVIDGMVSRFGKYAIKSVQPVKSGVSGEYFADADLAKRLWDLCFKSSI